MIIIEGKTIKLFGMYAIVDIETTGNHSRYSGITEVAILISDGEKVVDRFVSLVNPGARIPGYITSLTGISAPMLEDAPSFPEIAQKVFEMIDGKIFVAHNVNFDYTFLKNQLSENKIEFNAKKLCTIRLARQIMPGLSSYSLGNLIRTLNIPVARRHRAEDDAIAAAYILHHLIKNDAEGCIEKSLKRNSREAVFPPHFCREDFDRLPEKPGVYYFLDHKGKPLYVGKAKKLRSRALNHFSGASNLKDKRRFFNAVRHVDYELCGNELVAFLLESHEIRRLWPPFNRSQKSSDATSGIFVYEDQKGFTRFAIGRAAPQNRAAAVFRTASEARSFLYEKALEHELCPKLCGLQNSSAPCLFHIVQNCNGSCGLGEDPAGYNLRAARFLENLSTAVGSYAIVGEGRDPDEISVILVENGGYIGFGFVDKSTPICDKEQVRSFVKPYPTNPDIQRILQHKLRKPSRDIVPL